MPDIEDTAVAGEGEDTVSAPAPAEGPSGDPAPEAPEAEA